VHSAELFKVHELIDDILVLLLTRRLVLNDATESYQHAFFLAFSQQLQLLLGPQSFVNLSDVHIGLKPSKQPEILEAQAKPLQIMIVLRHVCQPELIRGVPLEPRLKQPAIRDRLLGELPVVTILLEVPLLLALPLSELLVNIGLQVLGQAIVERFLLTPLAPSFLLMIPH